MTASLTTAQTFLDALAVALLRAGEYNRHDQTPPAAILWPDKDQLWEPLLPELRARLPLLTLGPYDVAQRSGPSYWLRCAMAATVEVDWPEEFTDADKRVPILYLPGVSRADLRAVEDAPRLLQPLAELQYRGVFWSQKNAKDWTPVAFLVSRDGGLGIDVSTDAATREALGHALPILATESVARLVRESPLNASFFYRVTTPDPAREILAWLNDPAGFRSSSTDEGWSAFRNGVKRGYGIDPETDGPITVAEALGKRHGPWAEIWSRYSEAPERWPNVAGQLRAARPSPVQRSLFEANPEEGWPQDNEVAEAALREQLTAMADDTQSIVRGRIRQLEHEHAPRRDWVWARLGQAPLAHALKWLATLAGGTERPLGGTRVNDIAVAWAEWGWQVDDAALHALALAERADDNAAVISAIRALYLPWLEHAALAFQEAYRLQPDAWQSATPFEVESGTCLLFSDALRLDLGRRLVTELEQRGLTVSHSWRFTALPGVTPTAKPAVSPVADRLVGASAFDTAPAVGGSRLTAEKLRGLLATDGYQVLRGAATGQPEISDARGWAELGAIDAYGHDHGRQLAHHINHELRALADRVEALILAGWQHVTVITDHGWLLLPGGLPKEELPQHFTEPRKGRCARLKASESVDAQTVPWHWDASVQVAVPRGIGCYEAGKEYEHGGLSPQECVVPVITVAGSGGVVSPVAIEGVQWVRLRCRVTLAEAPPGVSIDIRTKPGDPATSLTDGSVPIEDGTASAVVEDADLEQTAAFVVVVASDGTVLAQQLTTVGGE